MNNQFKPAELIANPSQMNLFQEASDIDLRIEEILARRRAMNCSGLNGEDAHLIRAAIEKSTGAA